MLSSNKIQLVEQDSFLNLPKLRKLNLSHNPLFALQDDLFCNTPSLEILSLSRLQLTDYADNLFDAIELERIETDDFHICCIAPLTILCNEKPPWYLSCGDLLPNHSVSKTFVSSAVEMFLFNLASFILVVSQMKKQSAFAVTATSINFSAILFCVFLVLIWLNNIHFEDSYIRFEQKWRTSLACFTAFTMVVMFGVLYSSFILLLSVSRLMVVIFPMTTKFKRKHFILKLVLHLCLVSFALSSVCTIFFQTFVVTLPHGLCLPFYDPTHSVLTITILTLFFGVYFSLITVAIICVHIALVCQLLLSEKHIHKIQHQSNAGLIVQLVVLTVAVMLCFDVSSVVHLYTLFEYSYPVLLIPWATATIMPTGSSLHAAVFVVVGVRKLFKKPSVEVKPVHQTNTSTKRTQFV